MRVFQVLSVAALSLAAYGQSAQQPQSQQQAAAVAKQLSPAAVHFVNIGEKLEGDYKFGYDTGKGNENGQSFREETRLPDGTVKGAYGFIDASGKMRIIRYTAGKDGFKAEGDIFQDGAPANTPGLNGPAASAAPRQAAPQPQYQAPAPQPQYQAPAPQPQYQQPAPQYQQPAYRAPQPAPQYQQPAPQYQQPAPQYQQPAPQYQAPQYQAPAYQTPAAPQYGPQSIQYRPSAPQYNQYQAPQPYASNAYPASLSGGYRQPSTGGLYASASAQRVQPAFPDFFRQSSQTPQQSYQAAPQNYRAPVSAAPVAPVQNYAPQQQYRQAAPYYQQPQAQPQPQPQYQPAARPASRPAPVASFAPTNEAGPKKKYEDGQYDPELTKAGLYYPELYEKIPAPGKDSNGLAAAPVAQGPRQLPYFDPSLLTYNIGTQPIQQQQPKQKSS